ncbi:MAG: hypothetical protein CBC48_13925 [bacterium TMED88]|nr:hypothetical protein [Deltaproteobacteria bacterium]OUV27911.1 MAG: hypothetical protein CBC48_13925 [bacterium TMED88]
MHCLRFLFLAQLLALGTLILGSPAWAASSDATRDIYDDEAGDPTGPLPAEPGSQPLSINEAIAVGLQNNLDVQVNRYQPYIGELTAGAAWGAYDPTFNGDVGYNSDQFRNTNVLNNTGGTDNFDQQNITALISGQAGISALIPYWGASVDLSLDGSSLSSNQPFLPFSPLYNSGLTIGASIPLLRGLIWNEPWTQVKTTRLAYDADLDNFTTSVMNTVQQIIRNYWNLVATKEQVRVAEKSLESNQALLDQTKTQYEVGVVSKVEVVQAEAGVANSDFDLIVAKNNYRNAQDRLISDVLGDHLHASTDLLFYPTTSPQFTSVTPVDLNEAVSTAFAKRPELAAAQRRLDQGEVQLKFAKNQRLPQLDVGVRYRTGGTDGYANPSFDFFGNTDPFQPPPPAPPLTPDQRAKIEGNFGDTFDSYFNADRPRELIAQATISIPLGNIEGRKNVSKARIELRRANSQIVRLKQQIIVAVRAAARGLLASAQGVQAAERRRVAAVEQLRAEQIRLEHGESTPYDVLLRQSDLVDAESQKIGALQAFRNAQAELERQQGTILETWNVSIANVRELDYQSVGSLEAR